MQAVSRTACVCERAGTSTHALPSRSVSLDLQAGSEARESRFRGQDSEEDENRSRRCQGVNFDCCRSAARIDRDERLNGLCSAGRVDRLQDQV